MYLRTVVKVIICNRVALYHRKYRATGEGYPVPTGLWRDVVNSFSRVCIAEPRQSSFFTTTWSTLFCN